MFDALAMEQEQCNFWRNLCNATSGIAGLQSCGVALNIDVLHGMMIPVLVLPIDIGAYRGLTI